MIFAFSRLAFAAALRCFLCALQTQLLRALTSAMEQSARRLAGMRGPSPGEGGLGASGEGRRGVRHSGPQRPEQPGEGTSGNDGSLHGGASGRAQTAYTRPPPPRPVPATGSPGVSRAAAVVNSVARDLGSSVSALAGPAVQLLSPDQVSHAAAAAARLLSQDRFVSAAVARRMQAAVLVAAQAMRPRELGVALAALGELQVRQCSRNRLGMCGRPDGSSNSVPPSHAYGNRAVLRPCPRVAPAADGSDADGLGAAAQGAGGAAVRLAARLAAAAAVELGAHAAAAAVAVAGRVQPHGAAARETGRGLGEGAWEYSTVVYRHYTTETQRGLRSWAAPSFRGEVCMQDGERVPGCRKGCRAARVRVPLLSCKCHYSRPDCHCRRPPACARPPARWRRTTCGRWRNWSGRTGSLCPRRRTPKCTSGRPAAWCGRCSGAYRA